MKTLLLEGTGTAQQPIINRSYELIQEAYTEVIDAILKGLLGDPDEPYILYGCDIFLLDTELWGTRAGAIYHSGIVYLVDETLYADGFFPTAGQVVIWNIETTYDAVDPITFTDGTTHNVHRIRKAVATAGTTGAGNFDYEDCYDLRQRLSNKNAKYLADAFKAYDKTNDVWESTYTRFLGSSTFNAVKNGTIATIQFRLVVEFNNGGGNDLAIDSTAFGFDLPDWLQPLSTAKMVRIVSVDNSASATYNSPESCEMVIYTGSGITDAPDMYFTFYGYALDAAETRTMRKTDAFYNFNYAVNPPVRLTSGVQNFTLTIQGEFTYECSNSDIPKSI